MKYTVYCELELEGQITALFTVNWNWLLQGNGLGQAMNWQAGESLASPDIVRRNSTPTPIQITLQQPVPVHSKQRCCPSSANGRQRS